MDKITTTPGQLKDPFGDQPKQKAKPVQTKPAMPRIIPAVTGPYFCGASRFELQDVQKTKSLAPEEMEWIKNLASYLPKIMVRPHPKHMTVEDVEVAILLLSEQNLHDIIEKNGVGFDPQRKYNKTFANFNKKQREAFWVALAQRVLGVLETKKGSESKIQNPSS